jgi:hypothetical protein
MSKSNYNSSTARLTRIESKLVRGFEELGVSLDVDPEWMTVDDDANTVYVSTIGRSLVVVIQEMKARGATKVGQHYEIVHGGQVVASVLYNPRF